ncbi:unnamed protein product, partial [Laminaria digitata]
MTATQALDHPWLKAGGPVDDARVDTAVAASLHAFKDSCVMRRLGLQLVGRTLEAAKLLPAKQAFRILDPDGKGYITEDDLVEGLGRVPPPPLPFSTTSDSNTNNTSDYANGNSAAGATVEGADNTNKSSTSSSTADPTSTSTSKPTSTSTSTSDPTSTTSTSDPTSTWNPTPTSSSSSSSTLTPAATAAAVAREVFRSMDPEGFGRIGFSMFLGACLAGRSADEAGAREAFGWLDRRQKGAIRAADVKLLTGEVLTLHEVEQAFAEGHDVLDLMSEADAGPIGAAVREMEARKSAASGATGGFTYTEFYRLLSAVPDPVPFPIASAAAV